MTNNELIERIIYLSSKEKYLDKEMLEKFFWNLYDDLDDYTQSNFTDLRFEKISKQKDCRGTCSPFEGVITIDLDAIYAEEKEYYEKQKLSFLTQNLNILYTLIHEVEHLKEPSKIYKNTLEGNLLKYSQIDNTKLQLSIYDCDPSEKIAFVDSYLKFLKLLKAHPDFCDKYFNEYKYINNKLIQFTKMGYYYDEFMEKYNVPLVDFLRETNQLDALKVLFKIKKSNSNTNSKLSRLDIITRMKCGLAITKEHVEEINKKKILTKGTK